MFNRISQEMEELAPKPADSDRREETYDTAETEPISQLVLALPKNDHVRHQAIAVLAGRGIEIVDASPLVSAVISGKARDWRRAVVAAWCLSRVRMPEKERHSSVNHLAAIVANRIPFDHFGNAFLRLFKVTGAITLAIVLCVLITTSDMWLHSGNALLVSLFVLLATVIGSLCLSGTLIGPFLVPASVATDKARVNRIRAQAAETLGTIGDTNAVDALARAALEPSRVGLPALAALTQLLPGLTDEHRGALAAETVPNLARLLDSDFDPAAVVAILKALEQVGDGRVVRAVREMTFDWEPDTNVHQEAVRILPVLMERQRQEKEASMLLRAAEQTPGELLVRPAMSQPSGDPATLMRPAESAVNTDQ